MSSREFAKLLFCILNFRKLRALSTVVHGRSLLKYEMPLVVDNELCYKAWSDRGSLY